jgi:hypothetical protein
MEHLNTMQDHYYERVTDLLGGVQSSLDQGLPAPSTEAICLEWVTRLDGDYDLAVRFCERMQDNALYGAIARRCLAAFDRTDQPEETPEKPIQTQQKKELIPMPFIDKINLPELKEIPIPENTPETERKQIEEINQATREMNKNTDSLKVMVDGVTAKPWVFESDPDKLVEMIEGLRRERLQHYAAFWMLHNRRVKILSPIMERLGTDANRAECAAILEQIARGQEFIDQGYGPESVANVMMRPDEPKREAAFNLRQLSASISKTLRRELRSIQSLKNEAGKMEFA